MTATAGLDRGTRCALAALILLSGCDRGPEPSDDVVEDVSVRFRNVASPTPSVGDESCLSCHQDAADAYRTHAMARSFHRWTPDVRIETPLEEPVYHAPTGFQYSVVESDGALYQVEVLTGTDGRRLHELRRRIDYVMGSGSIARTYFTEENGWLFQLPLTWYRRKGWDFSPGYEVNNARFGRLMPDGCIACHSNYPQPLPFLEGKYAEPRPGIGCERCHGPGALHVRERSAGSPARGDWDSTIVNPRHLPLERRLDVCEQCHVHTPVTVLREGEDAFSYLPAEPLADHVAFFKAPGSIDIVSHADRLRQSACFVASRRTARPLECATCHDFHQPTSARAAPNGPCRSCHPAASLRERLASSAALPDHEATGACVDCHMPSVAERTVPHGSFTDHWIRVVTGDPRGPPARRAGDPTVEPYFVRDRSGSGSAVYRGMGEVVYATLADDARLLAAAVESLEEALSGDTTRRRDAYFVLGLAYRQLGRHDDAVRALESSLRVVADRPEVLHALARAYQGMGGAQDSVARLYERALQLQPALAWIRADYAAFLQGAGRRAEAEAAYRDALRERPSLPVAEFNLGTLLAETGRRGEASDAFRRAVQLDPTLGEAVATLLQIRTAGNEVVGARMLGSPLEASPVRRRGAQAVRLTMGGRGAVFVNVPPGSTLRIVEVDGTVVRVLRAADGPSVAWDLLTGAGLPLPSGLYHVQLGGQPSLPFGVVLLRGS